MNSTLIIVGVILIVLGFLVAVMKQTWLLSGFNEKRVSNKALLGKLVGGFEMIMGIVFIISGIFSIFSTNILVGILVVGILSLVVYSNLKLVDQ